MLPCQFPGKASCDAPGCLLLQLSCRPGMPVPGDRQFLDDSTCSQTAGCTSRQAGDIFLALSSILQDKHSSQDSGIVLGVCGLPAVVGVWRGGTCSVPCRSLFSHSLFKQRRVWVVAWAVPVPSLCCIWFILVCQVGRLRARPGRVPELGFAHISRRSAPPVPGLEGPGSKARAACVLREG